ncbi:MAG: transferase [Rhodoferax sp.]|uniref:spermine/spermidine synthase domain-containing protein n=1 Tax=Rhodoferax sp. TaxID=50421 RepID=UPI00301940C6
MPKFDEPFVFEADGSKSLFFTFDQLQSRMNSAQPTRLDVDYTRTMMGFLMFNPRPAHIAILGLGGGSLLKFCYRHLPASRYTVVEINPHVIALRDAFAVPQDDARINIVCADGADYLQNMTRNAWPRFDVLMVDGFDGQGQAPSLCTQAFYDDCFSALSPDGVMVANLHHDHPAHGVFSGRIRLAFEGNVLEIASKEKSNSILFAHKGGRISVEALRQNDALLNFDAEVRDQLKHEFSRITWEMTDPV